MNRKLLPYERGLCQQLGLSEDEYLLFLAAQKDYSISEVERREELRGEPVSIVLAVVGILFQVASALLAPKPESNPSGNISGSYGIKATPRALGLTARRS